MTPEPPGAAAVPPPAAAPAGSRRGVLFEAFAFWAVTAVSIRVAVSSGLSDDAVSVVKSLALVYLPLGWMLLGRRDLERYGLTLRGWKGSLALLAVVSVVTLVPFWGANHLWETAFLDHRFRWLGGMSRREAAELAAGGGWLSLAAGEVLAVALPEEVFYRGYFQSRVGEALPGRARLFGASVGWSLPIASLVFVAGHLAVRPALWQLGIFFPGLVFGWMRVRSGSLLAPVLYHALCNVGMYVLQRSYV